MIRKLEKYKKKIQNPFVVQTIDILIDQLKLEEHNQKLERQREKSLKRLAKKWG